MIKSLDVDYEYAYRNYLSNLAYNERSLYEKAQAIDNGSVIFTEGVVDTIKEFISNISKAVMDTWHKFVRKVDSLFTANNAYLERNKDIILNKAPKAAKIKDYYRYDTDGIKNTKIPSVDDMRIKGKSFKDDKEFIAALSEYNKFMKDKDKSFVDNIKDHLRGGDSTTIDSSALDMKKLYNYCHDYNGNIKKGIEANVDRLQESNKKAFAEVEKIARGSKSTFDKSKNVESSTDKEDSSSNTNTSDTKDSAAKEESFMYNAMQYYFNEVEVEDKEPNTNNANSTTDNNTTSTTTTDTANTDDEKKRKEELIKLYFNTTSQFLGAQMNIANEAYKTYFQIIKWHVANYNKDDKPDKEKKADTNKAETKEDKSKEADNEKKEEEKK